MQAQADEHFRKASIYLSLAAILWILSFFYLTVHIPLPFGILFVMSPWTPVVWALGILGIVEIRRALSFQKRIV